MLFRVLGPLEVVGDAGAVVRLGGSRERLVLSMLLLGADRLVPTDRLIDAMWGEPPRTGRQQLQNLIAGLRRRLVSHDPGLVVTRPLGYELRLGEHALDVTEFRRLVRDADGLQAGGDLEPARRLLESALDLWRGDVLADVPDGVESDTRLALVEERRAALDALLDVLHRLGRPDDVLARVAEPLAADPWNERLHAHRIRALASAGRRSEAIEAFLALRRELIDELGVTPGQVLVELNEQVLEGSDDLSRATPTPRRVPRELPPASWHLFGRDETVRAVVAALASTSSPDAPSTGDPAAPGARTAPARPDTLGSAPVTVVVAGVGGVGKTAVAVTAGHRLADDHPDGTLWIPLGEKAFATPADALHRALRSLGVDASEVPGDVEGRTSLYRSLLSDRRVLVVLDGATSEAQVRPLLPTSPGSSAIVTSRRKLAGLVGATRRTLSPLDAEASAALLTALAGVDRVAAAPAELGRIATLCGHLPLALCVVGARLAANEHLDLTDLRRRLGRERAQLDELAAGDIDVRTSIMTSVEGLGPGAMTLFGRLSLAPAGSWPGWVAQDLAGAPTWQRDLDELIDLHLVEPIGRDAAGQPRFRVLAPVRELAAELHASSAAPAGSTGPSDAELRSRLLAGWERLAAVADAAMRGAPSALDRRSGASVTSGPSVPAGGEGGSDADTEPDPFEAPAEKAPRDWFEIERPHLVAAVTGVAVRTDATDASDASDASGAGRPDASGAPASGPGGPPVADGTLAAHLALHANGFLATRAHDDDRERVLRHALAALPPEPDPALEVELLHALFAALAQRRELAELPGLAARQLAAARRLPDAAARAGEAGALTQAGWAAQALDRFAEAAGWFDQAAALAEERTDDRLRVTARAQSGVVLRNAGRAEEADPMLADMVEHVRVHGSPRSTCIWLVTRAEGLIDLGRHDEAGALLAEARDIAEGLGDELGVAHCALAQATALVRRGDARAAEEALAPAAEVLDAHAPDGVDPEVLRVRADARAVAGDTQGARAALLDAVARWRARGARIELARDLARLDALDALDAPDAPDALDAADAAGGRSAEVSAILADLGLDRRALRLGPRGVGEDPRSGSA